MSNYRIVYKETLEHSDRNSYSRRLRDAITNLMNSLKLTEISIPGTGIVYSIDSTEAYREAALMGSHYAAGNYQQVLNDANMLKADMNKVLKRTDKHQYTKDVHDSARAIIAYADEIVDIIGEMDLEAKGVRKK